MHVCISGGKKYSFFPKFGALCFFVTPVLRLALLPYCQQYLITIFSWKCNLWFSGVFRRYKAGLVVALIYTFTALLLTK